MPLPILKKLISFKTENPPGDEYKVVNYVSRLFFQHKIKYRQYAKVRGRDNIIGEIGSGKPRLLIACHADTVPAGEGWKSDPFKAVVKGGRVYGRGVVDDKGPLAALLAAAIRLKNEKLKGTLVIGCFADEEMGSELGLKWLVESGKVKVDYAIMPDIGDNMKVIDIAEKGVLQLALISTGRAAHGAQPEKGVNAITNLIDVLDEIRKYSFRQKRHKLLSRSSLNIGQIEGGNAPNMVPGKAIAVLDIRYLPSQSDTGILSEIEKLISKVKSKNKTISIKIEVINQLEPTELKGKNKLIDTIQKVSRRELGFTPKCIGLDGATDAKALILKGVPAIGWSLGDHDQMHIPNESLNVKELEKFSMLLEKVVRAFLS